MDEYQKMQYQGKAITMNEAELVDEIVTHAKLSRGAMSNDARVGSRQAIGIYDRELRRRVGISGDPTILDALNTRLEEEFSPKPVSKEKV